MRTKDTFAPPARTSSPTNQHFWHSLTTTNATKIWDTWTNVPSWKTWDTGLKNATIEGEFILGANGTITATNGRKTPFKVVEFLPGQIYTIRTNLPLGALFVRREINQDKGQTYFTHEVWFSGFSKLVFAGLLGPSFRRKLPEVMEFIKKGPAQ